ncbi:MAG: putative protein SGT1-like B [Streblomastix strix]|uniref:Suppressor of G2 allele of SKP1 n=1 Tax=Streblomastix strix TaxID=222440 RepID=A0A5J4VR73_9EUKA|nr:MAG: putative protein SGT1-like B [Streblomastix strix]
MAMQKPRYDIYQDDRHITITIYAKKLNKDNSTITVESGRAIFHLITETGDTWEYEIFLYGEVVPGSEKMQWKQTKVEIQLNKAREETWEQYERKPGDDIKQSGSKNNVQVGTGDAKKAPNVLYYPSSKGQRNWDDLAQQVKKDEDEEKKNLGGEDSLNDLLKNIYANADENTRRAMNKSFQESAGTVLSTNWGEVGKGEVKPQPPSGMIPKKLDI